MYERALEKKKKVWGPEHISTLCTVNNLKLLNASRSEHIKMEEIYPYALNQGDEAHDSK